MTPDRKDLPLNYIEVVAKKSESERVPLVVALHGRGADAADLADLAPYIDPAGSFRFLFANAPRPWEYQPGMTHGYSWFDGWPAKHETLLASRKELDAFLDETQKKYQVGDGQTALIGFSQGGLMAIDVGFRRKDRIGAIVVMSGAIYEPDIPDLTSRKDQPILLVHGTQDDVIPVLYARKTRRILEEHGLNVEYHEFPMGHGISAEAIEVVGDFLRQNLSLSGQ